MNAFAPIAQQLPALGICLFGGLLCLRLANALPRGRQRPNPAGFGARDESGTAMLDFVLTFPLFTMIILIVIQFALMVNARIVVSYAAFAAARSAVVWTEAGAEEAQRRAKAAAEIACLPISPALLGRVPNPSLVPLFVLGNETDQLEGSEFLRRVGRAGGKDLYSQIATEVAITGGDQKEGFGPHDPVTVTVTHRFHLVVPYADGVFGSFWGGSLLGWETIPITDSYTLVNAGKVITAGRTPPKPCPMGLSGILSLLRGLF